MALEPSITLFDYKSEFIHINIVAGFKDGDLVIDGYDIGKTVEEAWGDSDYEYILTIKRENVHLVFHALAVNPSNQNELLQVLASQFNGNKCFSEIEEFLKSNNIDCTRFTWT